MPHGAPDWSDVRKGAVIHRLDDMAELAARLGSIDTFDRRGDVVWFEGFEDGLGHLDTYEGVTLAKVGLSRSHSRNGLYSARLALGPGAANWGAIYKANPYQGQSKFGHEISFVNHFDVDTYDFRLSAHLDGATYTGRVRFNPLAKTLEYLNSAGGWTQLASSVNLSDDGLLFHTAKLVIDATAYTYTRFLLDNRIYNLEGIALHHQVVPAQPAVITSIVVTPKAAVSPIVYLDDLIVTQNEP